jgi:hypothetical protein
VLGLERQRLFCCAIPRIGRLLGTMGPFLRTGKCHHHRDVMKLDYLSLMISNFDIFFLMNVKFDTYLFVCIIINLAKY